MASDISIDDLRRLLAYDPETGEVTWKARTPDMINGATPERDCKAWNTKFAGQRAFHTDQNGYRRGFIGGRPMSEHWAAWALYHGRWPEHEIDHENGDPNDNRIENLQDVPHVVNQRNVRMRKSNTSGAVGVSRHKKSGKWQAVIRVDGRLRFLGLFTSFDRAVETRLAAEKEHGFTRRHGTNPEENTLATLDRALDVGAK